jgi:hypothetical protein
MARDITSGFQSAIIASDVVLAMFVSAEFTEGTINMWSGYGPVTWNSLDFTGVGDFGGISEIEETQNVQANGVVFTLSGIPSSLVSTALTYNYSGRPIKLWLAPLSVTTGIAIPNPYMSFEGRMDTMTINEGAQTATISLTAESNLVDMMRANSGRYTNEDQQERYAGDLGLEYVAGLQGREDSWGVPFSATGSSSKNLNSTTRYVRQ